MDHIEQMKYFSLTKPPRKVLNVIALFINLSNLAALRDISYARRIPDDQPAGDPVQGAWCSCAVKLIKQ